MVNNPYILSKELESKFVFYNKQITIKYITKKITSNIKRKKIHQTLDKNYINWGCLKFAIRSLHGLGWTSFAQITK
jgi:hypothetical protein